MLLQRHVKSLFYETAPKILFPRRTSGPTRLVVRCPTNRYQTKLSARSAFSVDKIRRKRKTQRLKEWRGKLILFPINENKIRKVECKLATQHVGPIIPVKKDFPTIELREITKEEKKFKAYNTLRVAPSDARLIGISTKHTKETTGKRSNKMMS
uniref:Large ribosomal subunit protein eL13 n=1 Tax=Megaselia scalaris TaxID=36166 RepID=T1GQR6_MEGSC